MELFKGQSLLEFTERFKTDLDCEEYLSSLKSGKMDIAVANYEVYILGFQSLI